MDKRQIRATHLGWPQVTNLTGTIGWSSSASASSNAGSYAITGAGLSSSNYAISTSQAVGNASAYSVTPAPLNITANDAAKTYDGLAFSGGNGLSYAGFVNGDSAASLAGTASYGGTAQGATNAGSYTVTASGLSSANYTINWNPGTLNIKIPNLLSTLSAPLPSLIVEAKSKDTRKYNTPVRINLLKGRHQGNRH